jgi:hypothetical protein
LQRGRDYSYPRGMRTSSRESPDGRFRTPVVGRGFSSLPDKLEFRQNKKTNLITKVGILAERKGFEPSIPFRGIHTFQACSFNHSDTSLCQWECKLMDIFRPKQTLLKINLRNPWSRTSLLPAELPASS